MRSYRSITDIWVQKYATSVRSTGIVARSLLDKFRWNLQTPASANYPERYGENFEI